MAISGAFAATSAVVDGLLLAGAGTVAYKTVIDSTKASAKAIAQREIREALAQKGEHAANAGFNRKILGHDGLKLKAGSTGKLGLLDRLG